MINLLFNINYLIISLVNFWNIGMSVSSIRHASYMSFDGKPVNIWLYKNSFKVHAGNEVYIYDLEGRPVFIYYDDRLFVRGLNGEVIEKKWLSIKPLRRFLRHIYDMEEKRKIIEKAHARLRESLGMDIGEDLKLFISKILRKNHSILKREAEVFKKIYKPISILPPDQYLTIVLQPVEGCPYNKCSFCTFYKDRRFRFKTLEEFKEHVKLVKEFIGEGVKIRNRIFLADANALITPTGLLLQYMDIIWRFFEKKYIDGIYSFVDYFHSIKSVEELIKLKDLGLRRVYVGLESGNNEVLNILNKPGPSEKAVELVRQFKKAGINVGVIVLIGAGGSKYYEVHVDDTIKILNSMPLGKGDIIYLSRLKIFHDSPYAILSKKYGLRELKPDEMDKQISEIIGRLKFNDEKPVIAEYDIDEFVY